MMLEQRTEKRLTTFNRIGNCIVMVNRGVNTIPRFPSSTVLRRLARDLRIGAFEACEARAVVARALLWRSVMLKLREGNPAFLAANGFGE